MDCCMEDRTFQPEEAKQSALLAKILQNCKNPKLLNITQKHIRTLLKYLEDVEEMGPAAFVTKEEYQEFAIAKFFVDKCLDSLKATSTRREIEEGEIDSDTEDQEPRYSNREVDRDEEIPPLEAFHITPIEKKRRVCNFWKNVKEGDLYHVKVIDMDDDVYELLIINKYLDNERLIDLTINACMKKSSIKENLRVSDIVRVSVLGCAKDSTTYKLVVTADLSMVKIKIERSIQLGRISATELPFSPVEASKFRSLTQYITAHCSDRDPKILIENINALGIDPFKIYSLHPELNGKKQAMLKKDKTEPYKNELESAAALKQALIWKDKDEIQKALIYANRALELNPKYDLAYVIRGSLFVLKCKENPSSSHLSAVEDFIAALQLNSHSYLALNGISKMILKSADMFKEEKCYDKARKALECAMRLQENKNAEELLVKVSLYEQIELIRQRKTAE